MSLDTPQLSFDTPQLSFDTSGALPLTGVANEMIKSTKRTGLFGLRRKTKPVCTCHLYAQWIREQQQEHQQQQHQHQQKQHHHHQQEQEQKNRIFYHQNLGLNSQYKQPSNFTEINPYGIATQFDSQTFSMPIDNARSSGLSNISGKLITNNSDNYSYPTHENSLKTYHAHKSLQNPFLQFKTNSDRIRCGNETAITQTETRSPELYLYRKKMASQDLSGYDYGTSGRVRRWSGESSRFSVTESDNAYFQSQMECNCSRCQRTRRGVSFGPANTLLYPLDDPGSNSFGKIGGSSTYKQNSQLTTELLPLDAQIPLQFQMMSDSAMMCNLV